MYKFKDMKPMLIIKTIYPKKPFLSFNEWMAHISKNVKPNQNELVLSSKNQEK